MHKTQKEDEQNKKQKQKPRHKQISWKNILHQVDQHFLEN
jgi:hypothetical protein